MDIRERFATALHEVMELSREVGWPMVIGVQNEPERFGHFPGILYFQLPEGCDQTLIFAAMTMKDGIEGGLGKIIPGLKVTQIETSEYQKKLAEAEQSDKKVKGMMVEMPSVYLALQGKVIASE